MRSLTVRVTDDLHAAARRAAGTQSLTSFIREAIAEKVGRAAPLTRVGELERRVEELERQMKAIRR
jgi:hypothetical protein